MRRLFIIFLCLLVVVLHFTAKKTKDIMCQQKEMLVAVGEEGGIDWGSISQEKRA